MGVNNDLHDQIDHLEDYIESDPFKFPDDHLICECNCVSVADIKKHFASEREIDFEFLRQQYSFGTGCQSCLKTKTDWLKKIF